MRVLILYYKYLTISNIFISDEDFYAIAFDKIKIQISGFNASDAIYLSIALFTRIVSL